MPRIAGVDIPGEKRIVISLTYIYGISKHLSQKALKTLKMDENIRAKDVSEEELSTLGAYLEKNFTIEGQLRRQQSQNITRLKNIGCYRGLRHRLGLPVRGQRTKTNARTRKGKTKTVSVKKGVKEMKG
jgi:small subunit ribosomal protein S13